VFIKYTLKNPNKYRRYSVTFTAMKTENCDIRGSKCKTLCNTAWTKNANTPQRYVIRTFQGLLYPSDEDVL
jgi:hypothetical protein